MSTRNQNLLTIRLPRELRDAIDRIIVVTNKSKTEVVIELLRKALNMELPVTITLNADDFFTFKSDMESELSKLKTQLTNLQEIHESKLEAMVTLQDIYSKLTDVIIVYQNSKHHGTL